MIIHTCIIIIPNLNNYTITRTVLFNNDNDSNNNNNNLNQDNLLAMSIYRGGAWPAHPPPPPPTATAGWLYGQLRDWEPTILLN